MTCVSTANNICSTVVGQLFRYDDVNMQDIMSKLAVFAGAIGTNNIVNFFPVLKYLPGDVFHAKLLASSAKTVSDIFSQKYLQVQSSDNSKDGNTDSFIAVYRKIRSQKIAAGVKTYMDEKNLAKIIFELVLAGSETSSSTIVWCIIFVLQDASIQKKIFDEIDNNVGNKRISCWDKVKLKYQSAVVMETQRYASILPAPFHHTCRRGV
ncbi:cytochrome P450 1A1-like [Physella acuta]|uniref:cytochrome P450 1A1-like n=1 Tax=Physella acuta TaxID=109671 RepID=UPI0027DC62FC|nr:cytochrome P450 1A1-like [Physella acuta]